MDLAGEPLCSPPGQLVMRRRSRSALRDSAPSASYQSVGSSTRLSVETSPDREQEVERLYRTEGGKLWRAVMAYCGNPEVADAPHPLGGDEEHLSGRHEDETDERDHGYEREHQVESAGSDQEGGSITKTKEPEHRGCGEYDRERDVSGCLGSTLDWFRVDRPEDAHGPSKREGEDDCDEGDPRNGGAWSHDHGTTSAAILGGRLM